MFDIVEAIITLLECKNWIDRSKKFEKNVIHGQTVRPVEKYQRVKDVEN